MFEISERQGASVILGVCLAAIVLLVFIAMVMFGW